MLLCLILNHRQAGYIDSDPITATLHDCMRTINAKLFTDELLLDFYLILHAIGTYIISLHMLHAQQVAPKTIHRRRLSGARAPPLPPIIRTQNSDACQVHAFLS